MRISNGLALVFWFVLASGASADGVSVGDPAPDFELAASDGNTYELSDFRGQKAVVIAWFPKAFTGGCTIECKSFAANGDKIRAFDVAFFMASVDPVDANRAFAKDMNADFPILSDPDRNVAKAFGVLNSYGVSSRWTYYIGPDGKILEIDKQVSPRTSAEDVAATLGKLGISKAKTGGEGE